MPKPQTLVLLILALVTLVAASSSSRLRPVADTPPSRLHTHGLDIVLIQSGANGRSLALLSDDGEKRLVRLTPLCRCDAGSTDRDAAWSSDGTRIAYIHAGHISVVDPVTGRRLRIAANPDADDDSPAWSASGRLAFVRTLPAEVGYEEKVVVTGPDLTGLEVVAARSRLGYQEPVWSPDGSKLAYLAGATREDVGGVTELVVTNPESGRRLVLVAAASIDSPGWSPDGREIVVSLQPTRLDPSQIVAVDVTTGRTRLLTHLRDFGAALSHPHWSPTGAAILYNRIIRGAIFPEHGPAVLSVSPDGRQRQWLARNALALDWSPDGTEILFLAHYLDDGHRITLSAMRADGSGKRVLLDLDRTLDVLDLSPPSWRDVPFATTLSERG